MKFEIRNSFTGAVQFTAEIEADDNTPHAAKVGLAVLWALNNEVDLSMADLKEVNGIIRVGPSSDGWEFFGVYFNDCVMIKAGCRVFSAADARAHWTKTREGTPLGAERLRFVDFIEAHFEGMAE